MNGSAERQSQWEYLRRVDPDDAALAALGREGWELAGVAIRDGAPVLFFKRPAPDFRHQVTMDQKRRYYAQWGMTVGEEGEP